LLKESTETLTRRLPGAVFLEVAKVFDTVWVKSLLYKLTILNFPSYLVKTTSSYLDCRTFQTFFQSATSTCRGMRAGVAQGGLVSPVLFSLYVNDTHTPSRHVELAQYADKTAVVATSCSLSLLVGYLEAYLGRLERWIWDWRIAINVSKSTAILFVKAARRIQKSRPSAVSRRANTVGRNSTVTLDTHLTWSAHVNQVGKKVAQRLGVLGSLLNRRSGLFIRNGILFYKKLIRPMMDYTCPIWRSAARSHVWKLQVLQSKCLRIATNAPWYVSNRQIHEDLGNPFFADHIRALTGVSTQS
jgi:hypothetical protein